MANGIQFAGRERTLKFRPSSGALFEEMMGITISEALPASGTKSLATLLWCGFQHEDSRITTKKVLDGIDEYVELGGDITELWRMVVDQMALDGLFGKDSQEKAKAKGKDAAGAA